MQRGASLLELLLVLALAGVLAGFALPSGRHALDGILARQAAERVALAHARARQAALAFQRVTRLTVSDSAIAVAVGDSVHWTLPGPGVSGVGLMGGDPVIEYAPNGLAIGAANTRYDLTRGRARLAVLVSRLGRVRIVRSGG